ncbi:MAG: hypothetical protein FJZ56_00190 [Chlamydiae bacterium]|nr:hypothetical protein [Chlamydiota bacterium]
MKKELFEVFQGKKEWQIGKAIPVSKAFIHSDLTSKYQGLIGVIILAGGKGTRLGFNGPKGAFVFQGKTLFAHLFDKMKLYNVQVAVMTSDDNHKQTVEFFEKQNYFGLKKEAIDLFTQQTAPTLSKEGVWQDLSTPAGNGCMYSAFQKAGLIEKWQALGVEAINVIMIDNPLSNPCDTAALGLVHQGFDLVIKVVKKSSLDEKTGVLVEKDGKAYVKEYFELSQEERKSAFFSNTGMFSCSLDFIKKGADYRLPWHLVQKQNHYQFEKFIFDLYCLAKKWAVVEYRREEAFFPIKSLEDLLSK